MNVIYFPNLKATSNDKPVSTGTRVTDDSGVIHACMDVFARNDVDNPLYTTAAPADITVLATKFHDCATTSIQISSGAFVQVGTRTGDDAAMPGDISEINVNAAFGQPLDFRLGADATEAATNDPIFIINKGAAVSLKVQIPSGEKLWVRSLDAAVSSGLLVVNLLGVP